MREYKNGENVIFYKHANFNFEKELIGSLEIEIWQQIVKNSGTLLFVHTWYCSYLPNDK
jgi:hypothetical protein